MNKRGISPLIATVLIIGFTVALAAVIITWGTRFVQQTQEDVDVSTQIGLACSKLNFDIVDIDCITSTGGTAPFGGNLDNVTINSNSDETIADFTFRITNADGVQVDTAANAFGQADATLTGFDTNIYEISSTIIANNATRVEAIAHVTVGTTTEVCQAGIEKVEQTNVCGFSV